MIERISTARATTPEPDSSDIDDLIASEPSEVQALFDQLPKPLWKKQYDTMISHVANDDVDVLTDNKVAYLSNVLEARRTTFEEFKSNDPRFQEITPREFGEKLQGLLESAEEFLGAGQTARVKRLTVADGKRAAVKYLLTPTEKTLSAGGEHDMLWEVETVTRLEEEGQKLDAGKRIRVPHPYFYYKNKKLQCYGMEEIEGCTIEQLISNETPNTVAEIDQRATVREAVRQRYADAREQEALYAEIERFASATHKVCLHGDIKSANLMVNKDGTIYLIDFGQSVDVNTMSDKTREQFENLEADERDQLRLCIRSLLYEIVRGKAVSDIQTP